MRACFRQRRPVLPARCLHRPVIFVSRGELTGLYLACLRPTSGPNAEPSSTHAVSTRVKRYTGIYRRRRRYTTPSLAVRHGQGCCCNRGQRWRGCVFACLSISLLRVRPVCTQAHAATAVLQTATRARYSLTYPSVLFRSSTAYPPDNTPRMVTRSARCFGALRSAPSLVWSRMSAELHESQQVMITRPPIPSHIELQLSRSDRWQVQ